MININNFITKLYLETIILFDLIVLRPIFLTFKTKKKI